VKARGVKMEDQAKIQKVFESSPEKILIFFITLFDDSNETKRLHDHSIIIVHEKLT
jgi:hypothetical protein